MKRADITNHLTKTLAFVLVVVLLAGGVSKGQTVNAETKKYKRMIENLIIGIHSSNLGVKRECIFLAGKYEFSEAVDALIELLKSERNPKDRTLIAMALYRIGDEKGIQAVYESALVETDAKAKRISTAIVNEYKAHKTVVVNE
jgi:uncharacterized protein YdiU (UPF0061 family)